MFAAARAHAAASPWTLTTGNLQRQTAQWSSITSTGVMFTGDAAAPPHEVPWANVVSLERSNPLAAVDAGITLVLAGGARWVGVPGALGETSLQWTEQKLGSMTVPLRQVKSIERGVLPPLPPAATDRVQFTNGDAVSGVITNLSADSIVIKSDTGSSTVPLATVRRVTFAAVGGAAAPPSKKPDAVTLRLALDDGSRVDATDVASDGVTITFTPVGAKAPATLAVDSVFGIEHVDGPAMWLASTAPVFQSSVTYFPFAVEQPARFGIAAGGEPGAGHDIEVHDRSTLRFQIEPGWNRLHCQFSLCTGGASVSSWADATVRVRFDDRIVYEKLHVRADNPGGAIDLPLGAAKTVALETDFGSANGSAVDVDWIEPALLRAGTDETRPLQALPAGH